MDFHKMPEKDRLIMRKMALMAFSVCPEIVEGVPRDSDRWETAIECMAERLAEVIDEPLRN
jgi:hypothetical protein